MARYQNGERVQPLHGYPGASASYAELSRRYQRQIAASDQRLGPSAAALYDREAALQFVFPIEARPVIAPPAGASLKRTGF